MRPDLLLVKDYVSSLSMPKKGILHLRVELRHLQPEERQIVFARARRWWAGIRKIIAVHSC